ncbi:MAG: prolipoprotein diacylglyceryl transferase, partial [Phycisphaerales bacterium]|nr:prolipoprotein diacylglyceryl transferase [Phycisphaerales bacterium]
MPGTLAAIHFPPLNPDLIRFGPFAIRWYGLAYLAGFAGAYLVLRRLARSGYIALSETQVGDLLSWLIAGVMVGGRAGWWLFYHRGNGAAEPWYEPIALWHGGMSFHGGLIGVAVALVAWTRWNRAPFWSLADGLAVVAPIGLFFGRLANFVNAELVGRPTQVPWGVIFPGESFA